jgi:hypothetical protein
MGSPRSRSSLPPNPTIHSSPYPQPHPYTARDEKFIPASNAATSGNANAPKMVVPKPLGELSLNQPGEISTRLFQNYFNYIHPLWPILYKPLYASLDFTSPTSIMPPALVSAIFAIASSIKQPQPLATNTIVQKYQEPQIFFAEAIDLLQRGQGENTSPGSLNTLTPSILNCQVLTILTLQQHGIAEYSHAAALCAIASSMAIELRLHRPDSSGDSINGEVRSRLWWNLYILEKTISFEMGRPVILRLEETDCSYPSEFEADEFELMSAYARDQGLPERVRNTSIKLRTISGLRTTISLCVIIERICREIYGLSARKNIRTNPAAGENKRNELSLELRQWEKEIEGSPLRLDMSEDLTSVPATIANYLVRIFFFSIL